MREKGTLCANCLPYVFCALPGVGSSYDRSGDPQAWFNLFSQSKTSSSAGASQQVLQKVSRFRIISSDYVKRIGQRSHSSLSPESVNSASRSHDPQ